MRALISVLLLATAASRMVQLERQLAQTSWTAGAMVGLPAASCCEPQQYKCCQTNADCCSNWGKLECSVHCLHLCLPRYCLTCCLATSVYHPSHSHDIILPLLPLSRYICLSFLCLATSICLQMPLSDSYVSCVLFTNFCSAGRRLRLSRSHRQQHRQQASRRCSL